MERVVWVGPDGAAATECPVSLVTGESAALVEDFCAHRTVGGGADVLAWPARRVDAFLVLEGELRKAANG